MMMNSSPPHDSGANLAIMDSKYLSSNGNDPGQNGHVLKEENLATTTTTSPSKQRSPRKCLGQQMEQVETIAMPQPIVENGKSRQDSTSSTNENVPPVNSAGKVAITPKHQQQQTIYDKWGSTEVQLGVRCSSLCTSNGALISTPLNEPLVKTTWDAFQRGLRISGSNGKCLGWRVGSSDSFQWWSYGEVEDKVRNLCGALKTVEPQLVRQSCIGIYAACVPQWLICSLAINALSMITVPLYDTLGAESCCYIIKQVEMSLLFADSVAAVSRILSSASETPSLKRIVCFQQELSDELLEKAASNSILLVTLNDFLKGIEVDNDDDGVFDPPKAEYIAMVQYTSGTTGMPKGVIQTHRSYIANLAGIDYPFSAKLDPALTISQNDVGLQFLPLAHAYAQMYSMWLFFHGAAMGFFGGNVLKLCEDAAVLKPTIFPMVPRLMSRIYCKIKAEVGESGLKAKFFWYCYERKKDLMNRGIITRDSIWDTLAFRRVQNLVGGRVRFISVGSAPVSAEILEFWRVVFGALIVEGYGQTECTAVATIAIGPTGGSVGHPLPCNYVKLVDAPECGYFIKDGKGEVCIKGANVMSGYYKQPEKTVEAIDADGWLHTGDIGEFTPTDGSLRIFDRKKHIFKLAQGEYIAPEKIENIYVMCPLVAQIFVDGSSLESFTVAVVVPDAALAKTWAKTKNVDSETVTKNPDFLKHVLSEMTKVGKANRLNSLEQVKNIHLHVDGFTPSNDLLTPSLKNKRPELRRFFKGEIEAMYKAGPLMGETNGGDTCNGSTATK